MRSHIARSTSLGARSASRAAFVRPRFVFVIAVHDSDTRIAALLFIGLLVALQGFRVYIIGDDGHITDRVDLMCADEGEAKHRAKQLVDGHPIELWEGARKIARFDPPDGQSLKMLTEYLERALEFERLAASEQDEAFKAQLLKQAASYRRLGEKRAIEYGLPMPSKPAADKPTP